MTDTGEMSSAHSDAPLAIRFHGEIFEPLSSGALFWRSENALLVADLHFEKMSSFARRGQFLPPYDTGLTLSRLETDIVQTGAKKLIALGDSFHRDEGTTTLQEKDRVRLAKLMRHVDWVWLSGNHDPSPHELGGICGSKLEVRGLTLCHEPGSIEGPHMAGHLHPAARVSLNGRSTRRPCFAFDNRLMILPAYGSSTGSLNILSDPFYGLFRRDDLQVVMIGRDRLYPVNTRRLVTG